MVVGEGMKDKLTLCASLLYPLSPLQTIQNIDPLLEPKTIRQKLARAGINAANAMQPLNLLSGGEQTKVKLCILELHPTNFLI